MAVSEQRQAVTALPSGGALLSGGKSGKVEESGNPRQEMWRWVTQFQRFRRRLPTV